MREISILILFMLVACHKRESSEPSANTDSAPIKVLLARAETKTLPAFEPVVGTVKPSLEATISADILARILEFPVVSGQKVNQGDVIARLDDEELKATHERAKAALDQMDRELARQKKLLESNATSQSRYEQADVAERMARANLVKIKATLSKTVVVAPFAGTITRKFADTGDLAVPGKPLVQIEDPSSLRLETPVAESLAGDLTLGQTIRVQIEAVDLSVEGKIGELEPSADSASRTFLVKIDLPSSSDLRAGLFGRAWVPHGQRSLLLVPASAVVQRGQMEIAFVSTDGIAKLRLIKTVPHGNDQCSVLSGLSEGEDVVLSPPVSLRDGSPLTTN